MGHFRGKSHRTRGRDSSLRASERLCPCGIYQFEHADGVVGRINRDEGQGSKSEKLAAALESSTPIVIVTIQTFPHVLKAIEDSVGLKERRYAIIADEAHSSQTGRTANELKAALSKEASEDDADDLALSAEDMLAASVEARRASENLSYYAFTATALAGRCARKC